MIRIFWCPRTRAARAVWMAEEQPRVVTVGLTQDLKE